LTICNERILHYCINTNLSQFGQFQLDTDSDMLDMPDTQLTDTPDMADSDMADLWAMVSTSFLFKSGNADSSAVQF